MSSKFEKYPSWKPSHNNSVSFRIKQKFHTFINYRIGIHSKLTSIRSIRLWKILFFIFSISFLLHSFIYKTNRIKPLNVNYSELHSKKLKSYDEKFQGELLSKCPISERSFKSKLDDVFQYGCRDPLIESKKPRANAAFVVLARNSEIDGVILSMRSLERRFNQWFNYPWIFLNDEPFTDEFKIRVEEVASGKFEFGVIPLDKWNFKNQNSAFFNEAIESQGDRQIMYGNMPSYHSMCRFYSGYFFEHPLVKKLDWYWRVEPEVDFYCDLTYDPFIEMEKHGKKYGYTIAIKELVETVPNLFRFTKKFIKDNNIEVPDSWNLFTNKFKFYKGENDENYSDVKDLNSFFVKLQSNTIFNQAKLVFNNKSENSKFNSNDLQFLKSLINHSKKNGLISPIAEKYDNEEFNLCHFWSNFEIASNELFTSPKYKAYYDFLENSNGFFTERWGDAPVHSLAAGMFLNLSEIHYFRDIGYKHSTLGHCPYNSPNQLPYQSSPKFKHQVLPEDEIYYADYDTPVFDSKLSENLGASGCRCRCPSDHREIENSGGSCAPLWLKLTSDEFANGKDDPEFIGGLGTIKWLDLDKIENTAQSWLDSWVEQGKNIKDWKFTDKQKELLSLMYTS